MTPGIFKEGMAQAGEVQIGAAGRCKVLPTRRMRRKFRRWVRFAKSICASADRAFSGIFGNRREREDRQERQGKARGKTRPRFFPRVLAILASHFPSCAEV